MKILWNINWGFPSSCSRRRALWFSRAKQTTNRLSFRLISKRGLSFLESWSSISFLNMVLGDFISRYLRGIPLMASFLTWALVYLVQCNFFLHSIWGFLGTLHIGEEICWRPWRLRPYETESFRPKYWFYIDWLIMQTPFFIHHHAFLIQTLICIKIHRSLRPLLSPLLRHSLRLAECWVWEFSVHYELMRVVSRNIKTLNRLRSGADAKLSGEFLWPFRGILLPLWFPFGFRA